MRPRSRELFPAIDTVTWVFHAIANSERLPKS
jgi:hypothetical protein